MSHGVLSSLDGALWSCLLSWHGSILGAGQAEHAELVPSKKQRHELDTQVVALATVFIIFTDKFLREGFHQHVCCFSSCSAVTHSTHNSILLGNFFVLENVTFNQGRGNSDWESEEPRYCSDNLASPLTRGRNREPLMKESVEKDPVILINS